MARVLRWFLLGALSLGATTPGRSLELNGQSYFTQPPWRVEFTNYDWLVDQGGLNIFSPSHWRRTLGQISGDW